MMEEEVGKTGGDRGLSPKGNYVEQEHRDAMCSIGW